MLIQETAITVAYKPIEGLKKLYYSQPELLGDFFNEATVLPIPNQAPLEIPRIIVTTKGEHSQLNISPIAATFVSRYDAGYEKSWQLCSEHFTERMEPVFAFLNQLTKNTYEYTGIVSKVIYDSVRQDGVKKLSETLLKSDKIADIYDINLRYTFINEQKYFVNVMLQNIRPFYENICLGSIESERKRSQNPPEETIGAVIDINDRYGFSRKEKYTSDSHTLYHLSRIMDEVINQKLSTLIEEGVY